MERNIDIDEFTNFMLGFMDDNLYFLGKHCRETARIGLAVAGKLNITGQDKNILKYGALLHDIGKLYIPKAILLAPRKLSDKEFEIVKEHCVFGLKIINWFKLMSILIPFILFHHSRNGFGYPDLSYDSQIEPVLIDILTVADSYAAIKEKRAYNGNRNIDPINILKDTNDAKNKGINQEIVDVLSKIVC